jgi:transposase-like protein
MQPLPESQHNLTDAQYKVLNHLIDGISISEAARAAGVHRNTVTNWRRQIPAFAQLLDEALHERAVLFSEQTEALAFQALDVLRTILHNDDASPSVRRRAALAVLKMTPQPELRPTDSQRTPLPELCTEPEKLHNPHKAQPNGSLKSGKSCPSLPNRQPRSPSASPPNPAATRSAPAVPASNTSAAAPT